jgi:hypothetical protein
LADAKGFQQHAEHQLHLEHLKSVELFNSSAAMLALVIGLLTEAPTAPASPTKWVSDPLAAATWPVSANGLPSASNDQRFPA